MSVLCDSVSVSPSSLVPSSSSSTSSTVHNFSSRLLGIENSAVLNEKIIQGSPESSSDHLGDEVQTGFGSMGSLEESLPIKRGLSKFYAGKSRSFANLFEVTTVAEIAKPENLFNKKKRILRANKFYSTIDLYVPILDDDDQCSDGEVNKKVRREN